MLELKKNDFESFFEVPFEIYRGLPYVSILKMDLKRFLSLENPLFRTEKDFAYYTAFKDGKLAGRILTHIHHASNELYHKKQSYYGHFDCIDDVEVAQALLNKAEEFGKSWSCNEVIGNFNLTAMQMIGVLKKSYRDYHYSDQIYAPEYVAQLLEKCGYNSVFPMTVHETILDDLDLNSLMGPKQKEILANPDYQFEKLRRDNFNEIMEAMRLCLNDGFKDNPMFVPLTPEEVYFQAKDLMLVVDKEISVVVRFKGKPVGVIICIPNLNPFLQKTRSRLGLTTLWHFLKFKMTQESAVMIFYSVYREFHSQGLNGAMLWEVTKSLKARGYKKLAGTWIYEENKASLRQAEKMKGQVMQELCLYRKSL